MDTLFNNIDSFLSFLDNTPTPYLVLEELKTSLIESGAEVITISDIDKVLPGKMYVVTHNDLCLAGFCVPAKATGIRIAAAHTDYPVLKIKTTNLRAGTGALRINIEKYGGLINHCWLDRPLKICGRVYFSIENQIQFVDISDLGPRFVIPDAAIHMNRGINDNCTYSVQNQMLPLFGLGTDEGNEKFVELITKRIPGILGIDIEKNNILGFDLELVSSDNAFLSGFNNEFISAEGLDDKAMIHGVFSGFISSCHNPEDIFNSNTIKIAFAFNHEECGSQTSGGAKSVFTLELVKALCEKFGDGKHYLDICKEGIAISGDMAHATHPSYPEFSDATANIQMGKGMVIKTNWNQSYATNPEAIAIITKLCKDNDIPYQYFTNNSDKPGGGTIGPMMSANLGINTCDIGIPQLSMHAILEMEAVSDQLACGNLFKSFYLN